MADEKNETRPKSRAGMFALPAVLATALAVRAALLFEHGRHPLFGHMRLDEIEYHGLAIELVENGWALDYVPVHAPGYYYALALINTLFGEGPLWPRLFNVALSAGSIAMVYAIGKKLFGKGPGLASALLLGLYWPLMVFEQRLLAAPLFLFLVLLSLLLAIRADDAGPARKALPAWALAGASMGLAALARPTALAWAVAVCAWLLWRGASARSAQGLAAAGCVLAAALAVMAPALAHNHRLSGELFLLQRNGGLNFYLGNNPESNGIPYARPGGGWDAVESLPMKRAGISDDSGRDRFYFSEAFRFARRNPLAFGALLAKKALLALNRSEPRATLDPAFHRELFGVLKLPLAGFGAIVALAFAGAAAIKPRAPSHQLLIVFILAAWAVLAITVVASRYRVPLVAALALPAGAGLAAFGNALAELFSGWRKSASPRPAGRRLLQLGVLAGLGALVALLPVSPEYSAAEELSYLGEAYYKAGNEARANNCLRRAINLEPGNSLALRGLAAMDAARGNLDSALDYLYRARKADPESAAVNMDIGALHFKRGDCRLALGFMGAAADRRPTWVSGLAALASAEARCGDIEEARALLGRIHELRPNFEADAELLRNIGREPPPGVGGGL